MTVERKIPQLAFNAGEISNRRRGRIDLAKYPMAVEYMINFIACTAGEAERAPGFQFIGQAKDHTDAPRLMGVTYNDVQAYMVELGAEYARFFMLGAQIQEAGGALYEIATPYAAEDVWWLQRAQRSDTTFLAGGARRYAPQLLVRTSHANWSIEEWTCDTGPFLDPNDSAITVTPSGVTGSITLSASASLFDADMVGALWRVEEEDTNAYSMWETAKAYILGAVARFGPNVYECTTAGTSGAVAPVHTEGKRWDGKLSASAEWKYLHSGYGVARITAYTNATTVTATVLSLLPSTSPTKNWREGAFSDHRGWPVAVAFSGGRLWWLGTRYQPRTCWGSVGGNPFDFSPGPLADDAVTITLESIESNPIRAAAERGKVLYAFTSRRAYKIAGNQGAAITPDSNGADKVAGVGSNGVQPVDVGRAILFLDQSGVRLQELAFSEAAGDDAARNLSRLAEHMLRPGG